MSADLLLTIQAMATVMAMFSIICRAAKMTRQTPTVVRMQHLVMFAGLAFSLVLPALPGKTALVLAMLAWLSLSAPRWRNGLPEGLATDEMVRRLALEQTPGAMPQKKD